MDQSIVSFIIAVAALFVGTLLGYWQGRKDLIKTIVSRLNNDIHPYLDLYDDIYWK